MPNDHAMDPDCEYCLGDGGHYGGDRGAWAPCEHCDPVDRVHPDTDDEDPDDLVED